MDIDAINAACEAIARLKDSLDLRPPDKDVLDVWLYQRMLSSEELPGLDSRESCEPKVIRGTNFACAVIPFCDPYPDSSTAEIGNANPFRVLAGKYLDYHQPDINKLIKLCDTLDEESRKRKRGENSLNPAIYTKLGPFDLYVANEGKNRVDAYRRLHRDITALVSQKKYPISADLSLHEVKPWKNIFALEYTGHDEEILNKCKQQRKQFLIYPESLALMEAYGVEKGKPIYSLSAPIDIRKERLKIAHTFYTK